jgi:hypothetical protein
MSVGPEIIDRVCIGQVSSMFIAPAESASGKSRATGNQSPASPNHHLSKIKPVMLSAYRKPARGESLRFVGFVS